MLDEEAGQQGVWLYDDKERNTSVIAQRLVALWNSLLRWFQQLIRL